MASYEETLKKARTNWRGELDRGKRLLNVLAYANARWCQACRLGDTPTCGKWRNFVSKLEASLVKVSNQLGELATAQSFDYAPSAKSARDSIVSVNMFMGERKYRYAEHPHNLAELSKDSDSGDDYTYDPSTIPDYRPAPVSAWRSTWRPIVTEHVELVQEEEQKEEEQEEDSVAPAEELWIVKLSDDDYKVFSSKGEALSAATKEVENGMPVATVYSTKISSIVEAVVQRTIVVSNQ